MGLPIQEPEKDKRKKRRWDEETISGKIWHMENEAMKERDDALYKVV